MQDLTPSFPNDVAVTTIHLTARDLRWAAVASTVFLAVTLMLAGCGGTAPNTGAVRIAHPGDRKYSADPLADMAVFARTRQTSDTLAKNESEEARTALTPAGEINPSLAPGDLLLQQSRLLLSDLGSSGSSFFAFPTSKGRVCSLITGVRAGCLDSFSRFPGGVAYGFYDLAGSDSRPPAVYGLIPNDVESVGVVVAGREYKARVGNNAFFYELQPGDDLSSLESLTVRYADGAAEKINLAMQQPAG